MTRIGLVALNLLLACAAAAQPIHPESNGIHVFSDGIRGGPTTFAILTTAPAYAVDGTAVYCKDCLRGAPCIQGTNCTPTTCGAWAFRQGGVFVCIDQTGAGAASSSPIPSSVFDCVEDFTGLPGATFPYGACGFTWTRQSGNGCQGSNATPTNIYNHPGLTTMVIGSTALSTCSAILFGNAGAGLNYLPLTSLSSNPGWWFEFDMRYETGAVLTGWVDEWGVVANTTGLCCTTTCGNEGDGLWIRHTTAEASGDFQCCSTKGAGNRTCVDMGVAPTLGIFYRFRVDMSDSTHVRCALTPEGGSTTTVLKTDQIPNSNVGMNAVLIGEDCSGTPSGTLDLDYLWWHQPLSR